jgi:hypothetical protein
VDTLNSNDPRVRMLSAMIYRAVKESSVDSHVGAFHKNGRVLFDGELELHEIAKAVLRDLDPILL